VPQNRHQIFTSGFTRNSCFSPGPLPPFVLPPFFSQALVDMFSVKRSNVDPQFMLSGTISPECVTLRRVSVKSRQLPFFPPFLSLFFPPSVFARCREGYFSPTGLLASPCMDLSVAQLPGLQHPSPQCKLPLVPFTVVFGFCAWLVNSFPLTELCTNRIAISHGSMCMPPKRDFPPCSVGLTFLPLSGLRSFFFGAGSRRSWIPSIDPFQ